MLIGVVLALLCAEAVFRIADVRPPQPESEKGGKFYYWSLEKHGPFHDYPWEVEKGTHTYRVIALGDSFTAGRKVPLDELFVKRVERSLNARAQGRRSYQVYNLSQPGWHTRNELIALQKIGLDYDPDAVVVVWYVNDGTQLDGHLEIIRSMHRDVYQREGWLNGASLVYDYVDYAIRKYRVSRATIADYRASFFAGPEQQARWADCKEALAEIQALSEQHGFKLGLVIFPMLVRLDAGHELADVYELVAEYGSSLGIPTLNLLPTFLGYDESEVWLGPANGHPNSFANELAAGAIEEFLVREGLVPSPERPQ